MQHHLAIAAQDPPQDGSLPCPAALEARIGNADVDDREMKPGQARIAHGGLKAFNLQERKLLLLDEGDERLGAPVDDRGQV